VKICWGCVHNSSQDISLSRGGRHPEDSVGRREANIEVIVKEFTSDRIFLHMSCGKRAFELRMQLCLFRISFWLEGLGVKLSM